MRKKRNLCWKCKYWQECFKSRYGNKPEDYMKKIWREKDDWGQDVIYVEECEKFKYEHYDTPKVKISEFM